MNVAVAPTAIVLVVALAACDATLPEIEERPELPIPVVVVPHAEGGGAVWGVESARLTHTTDLPCRSSSPNNAIGWYSNDLEYLRMVPAEGDLATSHTWFGITNEELCEGTPQLGKLRVQSHVYRDPLAGRSLERNGESLPWDLRWLGEPSDWSEEAVDWHTVGCN